MSYILDALRKAERERKLGRVPALSTESTETKPRRGLPWGWIASGVLAIAVLVLALLFWRQQAATPVRVAQQSPAVPASPANVAAAQSAPSAIAPGAQGESDMQTVTVNTPHGPVTTRMPTAITPLAGPPAPAGNDNADEATEAAPDVAEPVPTPVEKVAPQPVPAAPPKTALGSAPEPESESEPEPKPAAEPAPQAMPAPQKPAQPDAASARSMLSYNGLPAATRNSIGALDMNVLIYSSTPGHGFVIINGKKYREGDTLAAGPEVVEILPDGVVLYYRDTEFLLPVPR